MFYKGLYSDVASTSIRKSLTFLKRSHKMLRIRLWPVTTRKSLTPDCISDILLELQADLVGVRRIPERRLRRIIESRSSRPFFGCYGSEKIRNKIRNLVNNSSTISRSRITWVLGSAGKIEHPRLRTVICIKCSDSRDSVI